MYRNKAKTSLCVFFSVITFNSKNKVLAILSGTFFLGIK